ncbi:hypothetical protein RI129_006198 [Pyrocoelia pectoralis]|uniref:Cyclic nucleotide-binding domain-containing protein n=1 Tax=Pyrocoelia pectoralis TaxID=417401 RepID=A0AAN7VGK0_9COLE
MIIKKFGKLQTLHNTAKMIPSLIITITPEQILAKQFRAKCRFKAVVRKVIRNIYWLDDIEDRIISDDVNKNIYLLTRRKSSNTLSINDKSILCTPVDKRTDMDKAHLYRTIGGLKCFRRYPGNVKVQLAAVTYFAYFGPGRVIYREGHAPFALYFIISGEVIISHLVYDPVLDKKVNQEIARRGPGAVLGEVSLLHNIPRTVTITTNTHTEFLRLRKYDFNIVLKGTVQQQWLVVQRSLDMFTYFDSWDDITRRDCLDETILGDGVGLKDYVYFILKGQCRIIQHMYSTHYTKNGRVFYKICRPGTLVLFLMNLKTRKTSQCDHYKIHCSVSYNSKLTKRFRSNAELHFMQVCILNATACFAIGEDFENRRVVAMSNVECLLIPRYWLKQKNVGNIWNRVKQYLNSHIPSTSQIQEEFLKQRKWRQHKKETVDALLAKKQSADHALLCDVPLFIRLNEKIDE